MEYYNDAEKAQDAKDMLVDDVRENLEKKGQDYDAAKVKAKEKEYKYEEEKESGSKLMTALRVIIEDVIWCVIACVEVFFCFIRFIYANNFAGIFTIKNAILLVIFAVVDVILFLLNRKLERKIKEKQREKAKEKAKVVKNN